MLFNALLNVAFYLGCLLWAVYLKSMDAIIQDNPCFGETFNESEALDEVNYLINLLESDLKKDVKYYMGKNYEPNPEYLPILKMYSEFLVLNNGFVNLEKTADIVLPSGLKKVKADELKKIKEYIGGAILNKDLTILFNAFGYIL